MKECCIFAGAKILDYSNIEIADNSYIICADGGYSHVKKLGITPDVILGDFDTLTEEITENCEVIRYPSEKDDTDSMLAIKLAIARNYTNIKIYGGVGGRLDHTLANIQSLAYINNQNAKAVIYGDNEIITLIRDEKVTFEKLNGYYFSLFSFSEKCLGVTSRGTKYDLTNATLTNSFPLGISNEIQNDFATVEVKNGSLLIIYSK